MILELLYFFLLIFLVIYVPGSLLVKLLRLQTDSIIKLAQSLGLGIAVFLIYIYFSSWFNLEWTYNLVVAISAIYYFKKIYRKPKFVSMNIPFPELTVICLGILYAISIMWSSGTIKDGFLVFSGINASDGMWHVSLINNLRNNFPPTHPGISGLDIRGYNYFYDLMLAYFSKFYLLDAFDLFFRYFTIFISLFYGLSAWGLAKFLKMERTTAIVFLILIYFASGFPRFLPIGNIKSYDSGIVQTMANIVDPSIILSVALTFVTFTLLFSKRSKYSFILPALVISILPMIKIYTGFLVFAGVGFLIIYSLIRKRELFYLKILLISGSIAAFTYIPSNLGAGSLIWAPGILMKHYMESVSVANGFDWHLKLAIFEQHRNIIKIFLYQYLIPGLLFFIPSLGLSALNIFNIRIFLNRAFYTEKNLFWIAVVLVGFLIPMFFIQNIAAFVIVQFLWVIYFFLLIPTAFTLTRLFGNTNRIKFFGIIFLIFIFSFFNNYYFLKLYSNDIKKFDQGYHSVAEKIKLLPGDVLVLNTYQTKRGLTTDYSVPLISSLSSKSIYYEPEVMEFIGIENIVEKRKKDIAEINSLLYPCRMPKAEQKIMKVMRENNLQNLLLLRESECLRKSKSLERIYINDRFDLYRINET